MGSTMERTTLEDQPTHGNLAILTKVDKLRELIGTKVALPQLVVVGDQSSGKSSVLEGLTGFGFPRDAELCTRYATQITCRRENVESINVSIIPHADSPAFEQERVKRFHRTLKEMSPESLAQLFKEANEAMGIRSSTNTTLSDGSTLPAFSEHILKIEKLGPNEEHFTVIDVPGIFRKETEGVTTEDDIELVMNMVKNYTTQEILKLAKRADPSMVRTMAVLTKPDLAIESTMQNIAISHVLGTRSDLLLGYYIVKNRGPDDADKTLEQGQADEKRFFSQSPWVVLRNTGKAGITALKARVRDLLIDLIKKEFPKLKTEVARELLGFRTQLDDMGQSRSNQHTQRAYLNRISEAFQTLARDALDAYYTGNKIFEERHDLRLITRVVEANEKYSDDMAINGHTRSFASNFTSEEDDTETRFIPQINKNRSTKVPEPEDGTYPELEEMFDPLDTVMPDISGQDDIMDYISGVYRDSRGLELGMVGGPLVSTMFKEQSKKWKPITLDYVSRVIWAVHHFIVQALETTCPDERVREELWSGYLLEELQKSYREAMDKAKYLLSIEREGIPLTLNHYFNDTLQKAQSGRLVSNIEKLGTEENLGMPDDNGVIVKSEPGIHLTWAQLKNFSFNMANSQYVQEYMHDLLKSYYKLSRKRFVDVVCQQAVNHHLLRGEGSPLQIFSTRMVLNLNEDQLDMIAAEDAPIKVRREKLGHAIEQFEHALKVLRGTD
ncbi:Interferon-induced GTP-binding protein Mx [Daldinia childiae]|uniref:Interferon-induced GTP-binding protein Mx n=1 Tax=Daldinia childiae TaxID=326645 RepID=UPI0014472C97|nr:Interferon-induced GTP-binding protein Mx [Daldinia childiae]KAF3062278.1 Interferon-induced GTP-binding protein Mx [Daldinia childiae]